MEPHADLQSGAQEQGTQSSAGGGTWLVCDPCPETGTLFCDIQGLCRACPVPLTKHTGKSRSMGAGGGTVNQRAPPSTAKVQLVGNLSSWRVKGWPGWAEQSPPKVLQDATPLPLFQGLSFTFPCAPTSLLKSSQPPSSQSSLSLELAKAGFCCWKRTS